MKLLKVIIRNFQSIREATVYLGDRGLVSVEGKNLDKGGAKSNGAGKSTLINAILWNAYGDSAKDLDSVDDVVMMGSKGGAAVETQWLDPIANVTYGIVRYRKHPKFKNSLLVFLLDGEKMTDITKGTASATQELVVTILGADQKTFEASCFQRQGAGAPDIPGMTDTELKTLLERVLPMDKLAPLYKVAAKNRDDKQATVDSIRRNIERLGLRFTDATLDLTEMRKNFVEWDDKVLLAKAKIQRDIYAYEQSIEGVTKGLKPQDKLDAAIAKFQALVDSYDDGPRRQFYAKQTILKQDIVKANVAMRSLADQCPTCSRPYDNYDQALKVAKQTVDNAVALHAIHAGDEHIFADAHGQYVSNKEKLDKLIMANRMQDLQLRDIERSKDEISRLQRDIGADQPNPHGEGISRLEARIRDLNEGIEADTKLLAEEELKLEVLAAVADTYSPKGVRYHLLEKATPKLNERTNYYLSQLTDGAMKAIWSTVTKLKSGEYKEKFSITVSGEGFLSYGSLSGGEQRKVRLACFFALQDLIADEATKNIELWCGDEIDHALDPAGLERLMSLLHEKVRKKSTILVISHNELREWIPNTVTVTKKNKVSTITGYLNEQP